MSKIKKFGIIALSVVTVIGLSGVAPAKAMTNAELQAQIQTLLAQIQALQAQLSAQGGTTGGGVAVSCDFTQNLYPGDSNAEVKCLQEYLNAAGYTVADSGAGSAGNETEYFGSLTKAAVTEWQDANGIQYGNWAGYFGPSSQAKYDELAAAGAGTGAGTGTGTGTGTVTVPAGTDLVVEEASDAPEARTLGSGTAFNPVLKVNLMAGASDVEITNITVKKSGLVSNTNINGVDVVDSSGARHGNVITSINADNTIDLNLSSDSVAVSANSSETLLFRVNLATGDYSGTVKLSVESMSTDASSVDASYPIVGAIMNIVNGGNALASTTLDVLKATGSSTLSIDDSTSQEITRFQIQEVSSNEGVYLNSLKLYNYGSADDNDYKDVTLESQEGDILATAQPSGKDVEFDLSNDPYEVEKGQTRYFVISATIIDGTGEDIEFVVYNDYDIDLEGTDTGVSVIPNASGSNDTNWPVGNGYNIQGIGKGSLAFSRASDSPSSSVSPGATGVTLAKFNARPTGEDYALRKVSFYISTGSGITGTVYVKVNGSTVYSAAGSNFTGTSAVEKSLSTYPTLTAGEDNSIEVIADVPTSATSSATYQVKSFDLTQAERSLTGDRLDPVVSTLDGFSLSVSAAGLDVTTLVQPVSGSTVAGQSDFELARFELNAGSGGEDVKVSKIQINHNGATTTNSNFNNWKLYQDTDNDGSFSDETALTTSNSTDQFSSITGSGDTMSFNLSNDILVPKDGDPVTLSLRTNVQSGAIDNATTTINIDGTNATVTAIGDDTGNTVNPNYSGSGQEFTVASSGNLVMSILSGSGQSPASNQLKTVGQVDTFFAFKLTSQYEDVKVSDLRLTATSTRSANQQLATTTLLNIKLYEGSVADANLVDSAAQFDACYPSYCEVTFSADDNIFDSAVPVTSKEVYVTADIGDTINPGGTAILGDDFAFKVASVNDVSSTGAYSAADITPSGTPSVDGNTYVVSQDVAVSGDDPSDLTPKYNTTFEVASFKIENNGSAPIYLSTSTFEFAQNGSGATSTNFKIYGSDIGGSVGDTSNWNGGSGYTAKTGTTGASSTIDFSVNNTITPTEAKITGGSHRWLTVKTASVGTPSGTGKSYELAVSSLGKVLYSVKESDLGYDGNGNGDIADTIRDIYIDGKPSISTVTTD